MRGRSPEVYKLSNLVFYTTFFVTYIMHNLLNSIPRFKQRFAIIIPPVGDIFSTLDAAKVADTVLFLISAKSNVEGETAEEIIDTWGENIILSARAQGLPTTIVALTDLDNLPQKVAGPFIITNY